VNSASGKLLATGQILERKTYLRQQKKTNKKYQNEYQFLWSHAHGFPSPSPTEQSTEINA